MFWCLPITIRTSQRNIDCRRSQNGLRARRRMSFPSSTRLLTACISRSGGEQCSPLGNHSKNWMVHLTSFERLQRPKPGRDWKKEVWLAYMLLWWAFHGGSRCSETNLTQTPGPLSMTSLGSSSRCLMLWACWPLINNAVNPKVGVRMTISSLSINTSMLTIFNILTGHWCLL